MSGSPRALTAPVKDALRAVLAALTAALLTLAAACAAQPKGDPDKLHVVTTFTLLTDMVKEIGGEQVDVHNLVPTGTDPHEYEPLPKDMNATSDADLLIYNGLNLEGGDVGWLKKLTGAVGFDESRLVEATAGIAPKYLKDESGTREPNPHAFLDPTVGIAMTENVTDALATALPRHAEQIRDRGAAYRHVLEGIDRDYRNQLGALPQDDRVLVASEHAFQYMVDTYGLTQLYIWEIDTDENGSPAQINRLVTQLERARPRHLFVESNVDTRPMETVSTEAGIPIFHARLHSDELGAAGSGAETYEEFLRSNLETIVAGLRR